MQSSAVLSCDAPYLPGTHFEYGTNAPGTNRSERRQLSWVIGGTVRPKKSQPERPIHRSVAWPNASTGSLDEQQSPATIHGKGNGRHLHMTSVGTTFTQPLIAPTAQPDPAQSVLLLQLLQNELPSPHWRRLLGRISKSVRSGVALAAAQEEVLAGQSELTRYVLQSAIQAELSGSPPDPALLTWLAGSQRVRQLSQQLFVACFYWLVVLALTVLLHVVLVVYVKPVFQTFASTFEDFAVYPLPSVGERSLFDVPWWTMGQMLLSVGLLIGAMRWWTGAGSFWLLAHTLPLVGPLLQWPDTARWLGLLAYLTANRKPLPESLHLAAQDVGNVAFVAPSKALETFVRRGGTLAQALDKTALLPASCLPLIAWGEGNQVLPEGLWLSRDLLTKRYEARMQALAKILPLALLLLSACVAFSSVFAAFSIVPRITQFLI